MAKQKKPSIERKSGLANTEEKAETRALKEWLQMVDKPLGVKEGTEEERERKEAEPKDGENSK